MGKCIKTRKFIKWNVLKGAGDTGMYWNVVSALAPAQPKPYATFHRHRYRQIF